MIIINENAEKKLIQALESHIEKGGANRCITIALSSLDMGQNQISALIAGLDSICTQKGSTAYRCFHGDIFLVDPNITLRNIQNILKAPLLEPVAAEIESNTTLFDLRLQGEEALKHAKLALAKRQQHEQKKNDDAMQKRIDEIEMIMNSTQIEDILKRRTIRKRPEMLIIEDDHFTQKLIAKTVDPRIHVTFADNAKDALLHYIALAPDMVLLDIGLPDLNGHEVMKHILTIDGEAYIVMLSGNADTRNVIRSVENGAQGFIGKPFNRTRLSAYAHKSPFIQSKLTTTGA